MLRLTDSYKVGLDLQHLDIGNVPGKGRSDLAEPMFEPLAGHAEEESCSNGSLKLVEREAHLELYQSESSAGFEEKHV